MTADRMMKRFNILIVLIITSLGTAAGSVSSGAAAEIVSRKTFSSAPPEYNAYYVEREGVKLRSGNNVSGDNGRTWKPSPITPDYSANLPFGYRRGGLMCGLDPASGRIVGALIALDTEGLDPSIHEPEVGQEAYYLRVRVSLDGGTTWAYDEPMIQTGEKYSKARPFDDLIIGRNALYLGDKGSIPVFTRDGKVLVPAQMTVLSENPDEKWYRPNHAFTWTDAVVLIGTWNGEKYEWERSSRIAITPDLSTRGMIEPTLFEAPDGRILAVMRGSNGGQGDPEFIIPSRRWQSISRDGGRTWSAPVPWTYDDGTDFFSPSSMSVLFRHSSGRGFWIGNISETNCKANHPRNPLIFGEVDSETLLLKKDSLLTVDKIEEADKDRLPLNLCHTGIYEDRETKELVITYIRAYKNHAVVEYVTVRVKVE